MHRLERVGELETFHALDEFLGETVEQLAMHENAARRHATLPGGLEAAQHGGVHGEVEVRVFTDDDGTLRSHLTSGRFVIAFGGQLANVRADVVAAGEANDIDIGMSRQRVARFFAEAVHEVDRAVGKARLDEQLREPLANLGRFFGRFEDRGVPFEQARREHPQRHGEREVPRRNDPHDAARLTTHVQILRGNLRLDDLSRRLPSGAVDVLHHVQAFDHLGPRLVNDFAAFAGQHRRELIDARFDQRRQFAEQVAALDAAGAPPRGLRFSCCLHGPIDIGLARSRIRAEHLVVAGGIQVLKRLAIVAARPLASDEHASLPRTAYGCARHTPPPMPHACETPYQSYECGRQPDSATATAVVRHGLERDNSTR